MYIFYNYYSIVLNYLSICSRIKLRLRDAAFEMHLSFHLWGSRITKPTFLCSNSTCLCFSCAENCLSKSYEVKEKEKKRARVGTFTLLVMSTTSGMGKESKKFYSRLSERCLISEINHT